MLVNEVANLCREIKEAEELVFGEIDGILISRRSSIPFRCTKADVLHFTEQNQM